MLSVDYKLGQAIKNNIYILAGEGKISRNHDVIVSISRAQVVMTERWIRTKIRKTPILHYLQDN